MADYSPPDKARMAQPARSGAPEHGSRSQERKAGWPGPAPAKRKGNGPQAGRSEGPAEQAKEGNGRTRDARADRAARSWRGAGRGADCGADRGAGAPSNRKPPKQKGTKRDQKSRAPSAPRRADPWPKKPQSNRQKEHSASTPRTGGGRRAPRKPGAERAGPPPRHGPQHRHRPGQAYAALDLGTNNCRLLIARPSGENFTVIDAFSRVVKLGEGLAATGRLSEKAMDRTIKALSVCADKLRRRRVHLARSVATEACRRASNGAQFIERVRRETGIVLDVISAEEEARLAVLGCHVLLEQGGGPAVIFDIGGGSTELVLVEPGENIPKILDWQSVPYGVVSLTDSVAREGASREERARRYRDMRRLMAESFAPFARRIAARSREPAIRLLGTSGTVTTLASVHLGLKQYDRKAVDGLIVPSPSMRAVSGELALMSREERSALPCIGEDRSDLVVAGCAILDAILDIWPARDLVVADRGIREGILRSLMADQLTPPAHERTRS